MPGPARDLLGKGLQTKKLQAQFPEPLYAKVKAFAGKSSEIDNFAHAVRELARSGATAVTDAPDGQGTLPYSSFSGESRTVHVKVDSDLLARITKYRNSRDDIDSTATALRNLVQVGLQQQQLL